MGASRTGRDVGRVGQVRRVGQVVVRAARAENEKAGRTGESRCLYFGNYSLIVRLSFALPVSFVKGKWGEKKNLLIGKFAN